MPTQPTDLAELSVEFAALRVFVKALAEVADQTRFRPSLAEHKDEHIHSMQEAGRTSEEIADFIEALDELRDSY